MERRNLLTILGQVSVVGLAGCLSTGDTAPTNERRVSIENQDSVPDDHDMQIQVEVLESEITDGNTARLRVTTTNMGSKRKISVDSGKCDLFNRNRGGSDSPPGLWLYHVDRTEYLDRKDDRWVPDVPSNQPRGFASYGCTPVVYDGGESVSTEYEMWDDYRVDGYLEPGTDRWEQDVFIWDDPTAEWNETPSATVTWGFSLSVEFPEIQNDTAIR